jgi:hypothetical protein
MITAGRRCTSPLNRATRRLFRFSPMPARCDDETAGAYCSQTARKRTAHARRTCIRDEGKRDDRARDDCNFPFFLLDIPSNPAQSSSLLPYYSLFTTFDASAARRSASLAGWYSFTHVRSFPPCFVSAETTPVSYGLPGSPHPVIGTKAWASSCAVRKTSVVRMGTTTVANLSLGFVVDA